MKKIAITTGDPAGIGPEIAAKALQFINLRKNIIYIIYGKFQVFTNGNSVEKISDPKSAKSAKMLYWIEIDDEVEIGKPTKISGKIAFSILERCANDLNAKKLDGVVTCPISKTAIQQTKPSFIGHTEFFAQRSDTKDVIMSFWGPHFNLALLTTHISIDKVSSKLTEEMLETRLKLIYQECNKIKSSSNFAMLAVNPHAGEKGAFGKDDILIESVLNKLSKQDIEIDGPFPADTFFASKTTNYDFIISAYHDQGLIPFKMISSEEGVNVTLGLPFVRTSVDHGTAYDIAGKNIASEKSLLTAIELAGKLLLPSGKNSQSNYTVFAQYYDEYMKHVPYDQWTKFILRQFNKKYKRKPNKVLEMACGTANISSRLVKKGIEVDAADNSQQMLNIASKKPFCPNLFNKDITASYQADAYELILLIYDSINYILKKEQITILFKNVYNSLKKKGLFIFDLSTQKNCHRNFDGFINLVDHPDSYMVHQSDYFPEESIHNTHLTFFDKKGYLFSRNDEIHKQKIYSNSEILQLIKKSKLKVLGIYSIGDPSNLLENDPTILDSNFTRLFYVLGK